MNVKTLEKTNFFKKLLKKKTLVGSCWQIFGVYYGDTVSYEKVGVYT